MFFSYWHRRRILWLVLVGALMGLDQLSKAYFASMMALGEAIPVTNWFNLVHVLNTGAAFSMFADAAGWQRPLLIGISFLVILPVTWACLFMKLEPMERWAGAWLVAGGTSNLMDRIQTGAVVDFLDLHWREWHWPAFNLADSYIVCAVGVWMLLTWPSAPTNATLTQTKAQA